MLLKHGPSSILETSLGFIVQYKTDVIVVNNLSKFVFIGSQLRLLSSIIKFYILSVNRFSP